MKRKKESKAWSTIFKKVASSRTLELFTKRARGLRSPKMVRSKLFHKKIKMI